MTALVLSVILTHFSIALSQSPPFRFSVGEEVGVTAPAFRCTSGAAGTECVRQTRLLLLEQEGRRHWTDAHRLCRQRDMFLVPSQQSLQNLLESGVLAQLPRPAGGLWLGARSLSHPPRLYQWLLPHGRPLFASVPVDGRVKDRLCLSLTGAAESSTVWRKCSELHHVLCVSDASTQSATQASHYQPHFTVLGLPSSQQPTPQQPTSSSSFEPTQPTVLPPSTQLALSTGRLSFAALMQLTLQCSPGDSVVKDGIIIATDRLNHEQINSTAVLNWEVVTQGPEGPPFWGSGAYWCQRYVRGAVEPVQSGQLLITDSTERLVLTVPVDQLVARFTELLSDSSQDEYYEEYGDSFGQASEQTDQDFLEEISSQRLAIQLHRALDHFKIRERIQYLAIVSEGQIAGFPNTEDETNATIIFQLNSELDAPSGNLVRSVFYCPEKQIGGAFWRQVTEESGLPLLTFPPMPSQTPCYSADGLLPLRRRCVASFTAGASWATACTDRGRCQSSEDQQCRSKTCPAGFFLQSLIPATGNASTSASGNNSNRTANGSASVQLCLLRLDGAAFEDQSAACRSRGGVLWIPHPEEMPQLRLSLLAERSLWLPTRRLWKNGPLWPLNIIAEREVPALGDVSLVLDSSLECLVQTSDGALHSADCFDTDHSTLCVSAAEDVSALPGTVLDLPRQPHLFFQQQGLFLNVTDVLDLVEDSSSVTDTLAPNINNSRIHCFSSTSSDSETGYMVENYNFRRRLTESDSVQQPSNFTTSNRNPIIFTRLSLRVGFGYAVCAISAGASAPYQRILSNRVDLANWFTGGNQYDFVVGFPSTRQWASRSCEPTFCLGTCACFSRSSDFRYQVDNTTGQYYSVSMHAIRAIEWEDEEKGGREFYLASIDLNPPQRRRKRQIRDQPVNVSRIVSEWLSSEAVSTRPARCCPEEHTTKPPLIWPRTCTSTKVTSSQLCIDTQGQPARRRCVTHPLNGALWSPVEFSDSSCATVSNVTRDLHRLAARRFKKNATADVATELRVLTRQPSLLTLQDIQSAVSTLEHIREIVGVYPPLPQLQEDMVRENVLTVVSQLMDADSVVVAESTTAFSAGPRAIQAMENILRALEGTNATANVRTANVIAISGAGVRGITVNGSSEPLGDRDGILSLLGREAALLLPDLRVARGATFLSMRDGRLLQSRGQRVTSRVVSALVNRRTADSLDTTVLFAFRSSSKSEDPPVCAYWDFTASVWSKRGCYLKSIRAGSDVCFCNHLTNFARIISFDPEAQSRESYVTDNQQRVLDVITYVGCTFSLIGLALTIGTFLLFRKWRRLRGNQIMLQLAVALVGVYVSFLVGLAVTRHPAACLAAAIALHYCLLAAFGWMTVEAVFQYLRFVRVLGTYIPRFMHKATLCAWGGALVPVIAVLAVDPSHYAGQRPHLCWMSFQSALYAFAVPALLVLVFNAVVFGLVVHALTCGRQSHLRTNQSERKLALTRLRMAVIICVLLGLPWLFGFVAVREARFTFAVLFCMCTTLQGFAIFILMVVGERSARELWRTLLRGQCCADEQKPPQSGSATAAATVSHSTTAAATKEGVNGSKPLVRKPDGRRNANERDDTEL